MRALLLVHCKAARFEEIAAMPAQPHIANWGIQTWAEGRRRPALTSRLRLLLRTLSQHNTTRHNTKSV